MYMYVYMYKQICIYIYRSAYIRAYTYAGGSAVSVFRDQHSRFRLPILWYTSIILRTKTTCRKNEKGLAGVGST